MPSPNAKEVFIKKITSPAKMRLFMLAKLPMAYLAEVRIATLSQTEATTTIPFKYLNKNPFRSIYFACLSMAAELSTGVLCLLHIHQAQPAISMLLVHMEASFTKKAVGKITFRCEDGEQICQTVERAKITGEGQIVTATSTGTDEAGDQVASFRFTWSFKTKSSGQ
ncbi:PaaI family thioesterase [Pontibacter sp. 13R65]|uniref:PaaI family thioesterase n=1 Tax=Pontibacter sp. 13R65 TaxID=3127458 RepID=UPI00301D5F35